jgi:acetyl esterase/lipase
VPVDYIEYPGVVHGFTQYTRVSPTARRALADAGAAMRTHLEPERGN